MCGGGKGGGVGEQQIRALGNPCSSFSLSSSSLCIRRGFDKNFTLGSAVQTVENNVQGFRFFFFGQRGTSFGASGEFAKSFQQVLTTLQQRFNISINGRGRIQLRPIFK